MEFVNSSSTEPKVNIDDPSLEDDDLWMSERFESLLPRIQEEWPNLAKQTLEATRGSFDELVKVIAKHTGGSSSGVQDQLEDLMNSAGDKTKDFAESLEPLEKQLETILDELNSNLRPRIEKPVRERPLLAIGMAAGIGIFIGILLSGRGRRSR